MRKLYLLFFGLILSLSLVSAFDSQTIFICGGDDELFIVCAPGDILNVPIGTLVTTTTTYSGINKVTLSINFTLNYNKEWRINTSETVRIYIKNSYGTPTDVKNISIVFNTSYINSVTTEHTGVGVYVSRFLISNQIGTTNISFSINGVYEIIEIKIIEKKKAFLPTIITTLKDRINRFSIWEILLGFLIFVCLVAMALIIIVFKRKRKKNKKS